MTQNMMIRTKSSRIAKTALIISIISLTLSLINFVINL